MMNEVQLVGRLVKDPVLKYSPDGVAVANITVACDRIGTDKTDFIPVVIWRKTAENTATYCRKGSMVGIVGRNQSRTFKDSNDKTQFRMEVHARGVKFLEPKNKGNNTQQNQNNGQDLRYNDDPFANDGQPLDIPQDDLPF